MEKTREHVLITGRAGTGKSTLLTHFRNKTNKNIVVLAPTGVAAVNVQGQTIHSFFGFKPTTTLKKVRSIKPRNKEIYQRIDTIVIDEISMVRADLLDCIDVFLRKWGREKGVAFGGIQMVFIGDLYQLPPILMGEEKHAFQDKYDSPYFFSSMVMNEPQKNMLFEGFSFSFVELEKIYRQKEDYFVKLLNAVRNNTVTHEMIQKLNERCDQDLISEKQNYITLTTTNAMADVENTNKLEKLKGKEFSFDAKLGGQIEKNTFPADEELIIKIGAQVMMLNNDKEGRWVNGTVGIVTEVLSKDKDEPERVVVALENGEDVEVKPKHWEVFKFEYDTETKAVVSESVGSFEQYPMRLAWAVTIHKAQGKTFDHVIIDMGRGAFTTGQTYVALSRCTSFEGLIFKRPLRKSDVIIDDHIVKFVTKCHYNEAEKEMSLEKKCKILKKAAKKKEKVRIVYLSGTDVKTERTIMPIKVKDIEYGGETYRGVEAKCEMNDDVRVFWVGRILELKY